MNYYQRANQLADELMLLPYSGIIYGLLFSVAFIGGFVLYMLASDFWNVGHCLAH